MEILERVRELVAPSTGVSNTTYACADCEGTFVSAKSPERAVCPDCLSHEVRPVE